MFSLNFLQSAELEHPIEDLWCMQLHTKTRAPYVKHDSRAVHKLHRYLMTA